MESPGSAGIGAPRAVLTLGTTQTIGYACSSYLPAGLAEPMARAVGAPVSLVFAAFSGAMLLQAVLGPAIGRWVDRDGGRAPLAIASLVFAAGLAGLGLSQAAWHLVLAWGVIGLGMALGLYDTAFAGLVGWFGQDARRSITGVTLIAGFASTIGWPLTAWLEAGVGWRGACFVWAGLNLALALPLHLSLPRGAAFHKHAAEASTEAPAPPDPRAGLNLALIALAFAVMASIGSAMSAHLPPILKAAGASPAAAVAAAALVGPAQVAARLAEFALVRRIHPLVSGRIAVLFFPLGAAVLLAFGPGAAAVFTVLYGAGNGLYTIVRGALPLALFGTGNYGARLGAINVPARLAQAAAPFVFALLLERSLGMALGVFAALGLTAVAAMLLLRRPKGA